MGIYIYLIPIPVPGYIFAPLYLLYCWYMAKRNMDNIGHTASALIPPPNCRLAPPVRLVFSSKMRILVR